MAKAKTCQNSSACMASLRMETASQELASGWKMYNFAEGLMGRKGGAIKTGFACCSCRTHQSAFDLTAGESADTCCVLQLLLRGSS